MPVFELRHVYYIHLIKNTFIMAIIELTFNRKSANVKPKDGSAPGTLITFNEINEMKDHKYKGKAIGFWSSDPNYKPESKQGWTFDDETGFVTAPCYAADEIIDLQAASAARHNAPMRY